MTFASTPYHVSFNISFGSESILDLFLFFFNFLYLYYVKLEFYYTPENHKIMELVILTYLGVFLRIFNWTYSFSKARI